MTISAGTVNALKALLRRADDEPHTITLLTDEELVAVEHDAACTPHPTPWITESPGVDRDLAGRFGVRSLLARGLLRETVPTPGAAPVLDVRPEVRIVLDTRRVGLGYIRAMRPQDGAGRSKIMVVQPELGTFEEDISIQGFHLFTACNYEDSTSRMAHWCLPDPTGRATGGVTHVPDAQWPAFLHAEFPDARVTNLSIEVFLPDGSGRREPEHWLLAYGGSAAVIAQPAPANGLAVRPVSTARLRDLLDDRVAQALQYARDQGSKA
ncbi:MAG: hypothetical protein ACRDO7_18475 [Nocardioidaceae bacterium]